MINPIFLNQKGDPKINQHQAEGEDYKFVNRGPFNGKVIIEDCKDMKDEFVNHGKISGGVERIPCKDEKAGGKNFNVPEENLDFYLRINYNH